MNMFLHPIHGFPDQEVHELSSRLLGLRYPVLLCCRGRKVRYSCRLLRLQELCVHRVQYHFLHKYRKLHLMVECKLVFCSVHHIPESMDGTLLHNQSQLFLCALIHPVVLSDPVERPVLRSLHLYLHSEQLMLTELQDL